MARDTDPPRTGLPSAAPPADEQHPSVIALDAPSMARDIRDATVIKDGELFLLTDLEGNAPRRSANGYGLYVRDTRYLGAYELAVQYLKPIILLSGGRSHLLGAHVLTNPALLTPDGQTVHEQSIQIRRYRVVRPMEIRESLSIQNYNRFALTLSVALHFETEFDDVFEVRGLVPRDLTRPPTTVTSSSGTLTFTRCGRDGYQRTTRIEFDPPPDRISNGTANYEVKLAPGGSQRITIAIGVEERAPDAEPEAPRPRAVGYRAWIADAPIIETSSGLFNAMIAQSRSDLRALLGTIHGLPYVAAGIPWYASLFGRDSLIVALQDLWISPTLARNTLRLLARLQGQREDPWRDESPGKIMHEMRRGELSNCGLVPFGPYFGTVDATPLWVLLLGEYYRATADLVLVRELLPNLEAALAWIDGEGDLDHDGFVEYSRGAETGLVNQGWKDSWDGIVHSDGSLAVGPIALTEVQAYVYAAKRSAAHLLRALGDSSRAAALDEAASRLKTAFNEAFWMPAANCYALGLDGAKRQIAVISSNPGHALWCGIATPERGAAVSARLLEEDMFTGWGIRTLSNREVAYNPVGYHVGTVWPHDNSLVALGLKRHRQESLMLEVLTGLYDATQHFPQFRMPELFCGFARSAFDVPVRYPVACSPQAWAAASWSAFLQAMLGLRQDAIAGELQIVRPMLPAWLQWVRVRGVTVGAGQVDLRYERSGDHTAVDVVEMRGPVRVAFAESWE